MSRPEPFVHEPGTGRGVVCLHANASTSAQWRGLMERLAPRFHVLAVDSDFSPRGRAPAGVGALPQVEVVELDELGH